VIADNPANKQQWIREINNAIANCRKRENANRQELPINRRMSMIERIEDQQMLLKLEAEKEEANAVNPSEVAAAGGAGGGHHAADAANTSGNRGRRVSYRQTIAATISVSNMTVPTSDSTASGGGSSGKGGGTHFPFSAKHPSEDGAVPEEHVIHGDATIVSYTPTKGAVDETETNAVSPAAGQGIGEKEINTKKVTSSSSTATVTADPDSSNVPTAADHSHRVNDDMNSPSSSFSTTSALPPLPTPEQRQQKQLEKKPVLQLQATYGTPKPRNPNSFYVIGYGEDYVEGTRKDISVQIVPGPDGKLYVKENDTWRKV
jgi:hypothetical protein